MATVSGQILINGKWVEGSNGSSKGLNPATGKFSSEDFSLANTKQIDAAVNAASECFTIYSQTTDGERATLLRTIGEQLEVSRPQIVERCNWETALPEDRINNELGRTISQLQMFANLLDKGDWKRPVIDTAQLERKPSPKPDLRLTQVPLGPVVVFSASNFPLAFSVAGGDTASALAAGCPVIVKTHNAHPGTSELVARAIISSIEKCALPMSTFSMVHGSGNTIGSQLVQHPKVKAIGFTGSVSGGRALHDIALSRPEPIPFFGELGSTNPVFLLPESLSNNTESIADSFLASLMMGVGQFCTSPGMLVAVKSPALEKLIAFLTEKTLKIASGTMLSATISDSYRKNCLKRQNLNALKEIAVGAKIGANLNQAQLVLFSIEGSDYLRQPQLEEEVFGPSGLVIVCEDANQLLEVATSMKGHLTGAIFANDKDHLIADQLLPILQKRVGRILFNGYGTGVELSSAMSHGGPYPSSTAASTTSVGTRAIERFTRPLCYQNTPETLLPTELKDSNPNGIMRLINNQWTDKSVGEA